MGAGGRMEGVEGVEGMEEVEGRSTMVHPLGVSSSYFRSETCSRSHVLLLSSNKYGFFTNLIETSGMETYSIAQKPTGYNVNYTQRGQC